MVIIKPGYRTRFNGLMTLEPELYRALCNCGWIVDDVAREETWDIACFVIEGRDYNVPLKFLQKVIGDHFEEELFTI